VLDEALLVRARSGSAGMARGCRHRLIKGPECWHIEVAGHGVIQAETIFLATASMIYANGDGPVGRRMTSSVSSVISC